MKLLALPLSVLLLAAGFLAAQAGAQAAPGEGVLYFTNTVGANPATGIKTFAMSVEEPAAASPLKAYAQTSLFASTYQTQFEFAFPEDTVLDGPISVQTWVSCDVAAPFRPAYQNTANDLHAYRIELYKGTTLLGESHSYSSLATCTGPSSVQQLTGLITLAAVDFSKGDVLGVRPLIWTVNPPEAQAKNVHFLVGSPSRASAIRGAGLPGGSSGPAEGAVVEDVLEGETARVEHAFTNATSDTYRFNWTTELTSAHIVFNVTADNGSARILVRDGAGEELLNETVEAGGTNGEAEVQSVEPGQWTIEIAYSAFMGTLNLTVGAIQTNETVSPTTSASNATGAATNETGAAQGADAGGVPGLGAVGLAAAVAVAVLVARRRR